MTGKILGQGAIRGDDGARYYYDEGAIKNPQEAQKINGCEVDFEIENGKAVDIFITKSGESNVKSSNNQTKQSADDLTKVSNEQVISKELNINNIKGFIFKGRVSNYRKEVISDTSGKFSIRNGKGGGSISTTHQHTIYFNLGKKTFAWQGNHPINNSDEVVLYAR